MVQVVLGVLGEIGGSRRKARTPERIPLRRMTKSFPKWVLEEVGETNIEYFTDWMNDNVFELRECWDSMGGVEQFEEGPSFGQFLIKMYFEQTREDIAQFHN